MSQDAALQGGVEFLPDVPGQTFGHGIGVEGGQKGFLVGGCAPEAPGLQCLLNFLHFSPPQDMAR
jgi:hypothetical protein